MMRIDPDRFEELADQYNARGVLPPSGRSRSRINPFKESGFSLRHNGADWPKKQMENRGRIELSRQDHRLTHHREPSVRDRTEIPALACNNRPTA